MDVPRTLRKGDWRICILERRSLCAAHGLHRIRWLVGLEHERPPRSASSEAPGQRGGSALPAVAPVEDREGWRDPVRPASARSRAITIASKAEAAVGSRRTWCWLSSGCCASRLPGHFREPWETMGVAKTSVPSDSSELLPTRIGM
jgi:hypothetical protein